MGLTDFSKNSTSAGGRGVPDEAQTNRAGSERRTNAPARVGREMEGFIGA